MREKVIELNETQRDQLNDQLFKIACDCDLREDDNVQYGECEVELDGELYIVEYSIRCAREYVSRFQTWDTPEEGGSEIDVRVERMYTYDDHDNEIEVEITDDIFEYEFEY